jgi:hypothetical protein
VTFHFKVVLSVVYTKDRYHNICTTQRPGQRGEEGRGRTKINYHTFKLSSDLLLLAEEYFLKRYDYGRRQRRNFETPHTQN